MKKFPLMACALALLCLLLPSCTRTDDPWKKMDEVLTRIVPPSFPDRVFRMTDYYDGADSLYTAAILAAVGDCAAQGGGHVVIPAGTWKTGPIRLQSGVDLHFEDGATLLFVPDPALHEIVHTHWEGIECYNVQALIYAEDAENIAVTGRGTIDGQASRENWYSYRDRARAVLYRWVAEQTPVEERVLPREDPARPQALNFMNCRNILLEDITIHRSPFWLIHPVLCTNVTLRRVTMDSHMGNNDGCDPESCTDVLFDGCVFDTGDDCIAVKSGRDADGRRLGVPSSNIIVRNCKMADGHAGVAIGSEISGGFHGLWVEDCEMDSPHLQRILRVKSNPQRGGSVSDLHVRRVTVGECDLAILGIELRYGRVSEGPYPLDFRSITIEDVTSRGSRYVVHVDGTDDAVGVHGITLRRCRLDGVREPEISHIVGAEDVLFEDVTVNGSPYQPTL